MYKQIIIARKDLNMSPGKLAAQVSHGSMAFLTTMIRNKPCKMYENRFEAKEQYYNEPAFYHNPSLNKLAEEAYENHQKYFYARPVEPFFYGGDWELCDPIYHYEPYLRIDSDLYEQWIEGIFTKCVLEAKNKNQLLKAKTLAEELGMKEGEDFFLIYDACLTELEPEEDGRTLTVIGFKPMDSEVIDQIGKKYQLYK